MVIRYNRLDIFGCIHDSILYGCLECFHYDHYGGVRGEPKSKVEVEPIVI